jgi:hypothetical protein
MKAGIRRMWVVVNMAKIGTGGFYHLAYALSQVEPELLQLLRRSSDYGRIYIHLVDDEHRAWPIAVGDVIAIHWFPEFIRVHFMIAQVTYPEKVAAVPWDVDYMLVMQSPKAKEVRGNA